MNYTSKQSTTWDSTAIQELVSSQRRFFAGGHSKDLKFRKAQLLKLKKMLIEHEDAIIEVLHNDLGKHEFEAYATEIGFVLVEIDKTLAKLSKWAKPKKLKPLLFYTLRRVRFRLNPTEIF